MRNVYNNRVTSCKECNLKTFIDECRYEVNEKQNDPYLLGRHDTPRKSINSAHASNPAGMPKKLNKKTCRGISMIAGSEYAVE
jgi:hypothetical protein